MKSIHPIRFDKQPLQDHCGIFAALSPENIPFFHKGLLGIKKLQTRGYDGAGFGAINSSGSMHVYKREGLIDEVFSARIVKKLQSIEARAWLFQTRYGTVGKFSRRNVQPFIRLHRGSKERFVVIHNGQFAQEKIHSLKDESDTLRFVQQLARAPEATWDQRIATLLQKKRGAWSVVIGTRQALYLARDPMGIRPLSYGMLPNGKSGPVWVAASETSALTAVGITRHFEVLPGELIKIAVDGPVRIDRITPRLGLCIFENVYLMKGEGQAHLPRAKNSEIDTSPTVDAIRTRSGTILAREAPLGPHEVDFVVGIPGTGITGGQAYAQALGLAYAQAITDRVPQGDQRTFMYAQIDKIYRRVLNHFNFDESMFWGKNVVLVDDSIVRGNIMTGLVGLLKKKYGVVACHVRVLSPPIDKICYLGINTRHKDELLAAQAETHLKEEKDLKKIVAHMAQELGVDSLAYISDSGLKEATTGNPRDRRFCFGCMFGNLPPITREGEYMKS